MQYWLLNEHLTEYETAPQINGPVYNKPWVYNGNVYGLTTPFNFLSLPNNQGYPAMLGYGDGQSFAIYVKTPGAPGGGYWLSGAYRQMVFNEDFNAPAELTQNATPIQTNTLVGKYRIKMDAVLPTEVLWTQNINCSVRSWDIGTIDGVGISFDEQNYINGFYVRRGAYIVLADGTTTQFMNETGLTAWNPLTSAYIDFGETPQQCSQLFYDWVMSNTVPYVNNTLTLYNNDGTQRLPQQPLLPELPNIESVMLQTASLNYNIILNCNDNGAYTGNFQLIEPSTPENAFVGFALTPNANVPDITLDYVKDIQLTGNINLYAVYDKLENTYTINDKGTVSVLNTKADVTSIEVTHAGDNSYSLFFNTVYGISYDYFVAQHQSDTATFVGFSLTPKTKTPDFAIGGVYQVNWTNDITLYAVYSEVPNPEYITFYKLTGERFRVDKTKYITDAINILGTTRAPVSITNPTIIIEDNTDSIFLSNPRNYAYIPAFHRYYYIDNIEIVRDKIYAVSMSVDVLMTYRNQIFNQTGYISRCEKLYNNRLQDNNVGCLNGASTKKYPFERAFSSQEIFQDPSAKCVVLSAIVDPPASWDWVSYNVDTRINRPLAPLNKYPKSPNLTDSNFKYIISPEDMDKVQSYILSPDFAGRDLFENRAEAIKDVTIFPIDLLTNIYVGKGYQGKMQLLTNTSLDVNLPTAVALKECVVVLDGGYVDFTNTTAYWYYEPYTQVNIYIPFLGQYSLNNELVFGHKIRVIGIVDINDGTMTAFVISDDTNIILTQKGTIAITIPFVSSNINSALKAVFTGLISGVGSMVAGAVSGGAGVISSGLGLITNTFNNAQMHYSMGNMSGGISSWMSPTKPYIELIQRERTAHDNVYRSLFGAPLMETKRIGELIGKGFTVISNIHIDNIGGILSNEQTEIESLLKNGVIL